MSKKAAKVSVRVASYNILSDALVVNTPWQYPNAVKNAGKRMAAILAKLKLEVCLTSLFFTGFHKLCAL